MEIRPTQAVIEMMIKIMVELLAVLALATKQISHGRLSKLRRSLSWQLMLDLSRENMQ